MPSADERPIMIMRFRKCLILLRTAVLTDSHYKRVIITMALGDPAFQVRFSHPAPRQGCSRRTVKKPRLTGLDSRPAALVDNSMLAQANYRIRRLRAAESP